MKKWIADSVDGRPSSKESSWRLEEGFGVTSQSLQTQFCLNLALSSSKIQRVLWKKTFSDI